jgi:hypothetical protein
MADSRNQNNFWDHLLYFLSGGGIAFNTTFDQEKTKQNNEALKNWIRQNYGDLNLNNDQLEALANQYGDTSDAKWWQIISSGYDSSDYKALENELNKLRTAYDELGEAPDRLSTDDIESIRKQAYAEIDAENQKLLDLYNQTFENSGNLLNNELNQNAAMFNDYRNQILTNEAMRQQALAGSTRFELDRQQRNAITRGASAAQRLVANINAQLGMQAQSAQQSLDTSNALAQNLLAHRQAQQGIRNSYMNAQNTYNQNMANLYSGQAERRFGYGQSKVEAADSDRERAYQSWLDRRDDYFKLDSFGSGLYGSGKKNSNAI